MNSHVKIYPWAGRGNRPFAPSMETVRIRFYVALLLTDIVLINFAFLISGGLRTGNFLALDAARQAVLLTPLFVVIAWNNGVYSARSLSDAGYAVSRVIAAILPATGVLLLVTFYAKISNDLSRSIFTIGVLLTITAIAAFRYMVARYMTSTWGPDAQNVLVIEDGGVPVELQNAYRLDTTDGFLDLNVDDPGALDRLGRYVENMDRVIVSCPPAKRKHWVFYLRAAGVDGEVVTEIGHELGAVGLRRSRNFTAMVVSTRPLPLSQRAVKRIMDLGIAIGALLFFAPILLTIILAIKLDDGGPILFRQRRMGRGNRFFHIYKFRSMRVTHSDLEGVQSASPDDKRITRVGRLIRRTSLDELPQLFNVIKGDMSLVGPRPHALGSQAGQKLFWEIDARYWHRHSLRPGLTGLAQIRGYRGATESEGDLSNRLRCDLEYIANWSPWWDFLILFRTTFVFAHKNAF